MSHKCQSYTTNTDYNGQNLADDDWTRCGNLFIPEIILIISVDYINLMHLNN